MDYPHPQTANNLDSASALELRIIALENKITDSKEVANILGALEQRIHILEEARQRQIALNATFQTVQTIKKKLWPFTWNAENYMEHSTNLITGNVESTQRKCAS